MTSGGGAAIRILIVDDSADFLSSARRTVEAEPGLRVVGTAYSGVEALAKIGELHPDLVLLDLAMPGMSGLEVLRRVKSEPSPPQVVIVTLYDEPEYRSAAQQAGADGFIAKSDFGSRLHQLVGAPLGPEKSSADPCDGEDGDHS